MHKIKQIAKVLTLFAVFLSVLIALSERPANAATVKLNKKSATIDLEEKVKLKVKNTKKKVTWSSSDKTIAKVTKLGNVYAVSKGECTITAKVGKKTLTCAITVTDNVGELLDDTFSIYDMEFLRSSKWEIMDPESMPSNDSVAYKIDNTVFKDINIKTDLMLEDEFKNYTASKDNFNMFCALMADKIKKDFKASNVKMEILEMEAGYIGRNTASFINDGISYSLVEYIRMTDGQTITIIGMEAGEPTTILDKIARRICLEAHLMTVG